MSSMDTCRCKEYQAARNGVGACTCTHDQHYHKRGIGPCWYPTQKGSR